MPDKWKRVWFALFLLIIFLAGVGAGMVVNRRAGPLRSFGFPRPGVPGILRPPAPTPGLLAGRLAEELDLTDKQKTQLEATFAARRQRLAAFHREVRQRFETEQQELHDEIRKLLTPAQRDRFEQWVRRRPLRRPGGRF